jgi:hypothetical protein
MNDFAACLPISHDLPALIQKSHTSRQCLANRTNTDRGHDGFSLLDGQLAAQLDGIAERYLLRTRTVERDFGDNAT